MGGYMQSADLLFKETVQTIIQDRTALLRIYLWNMLKLVFWYVLPYLILIENHPKIDFLLTISFISFAVVLSGLFLRLLVLVPLNLSICYYSDQLLEQLTQFLRFYCIVSVPLSCHFSMDLCM